MQGIDPKWVFYLGIVVTIEEGIAGGSIKLAHAIPDSWIPVVDAWASILAFSGTAIMTALSAYSSKAAGPLIQPPPPAVKVLAWLILPLALVLLMGNPAGAQDRSPRQGIQLPQIRLPGQGSNETQPGAPTGGDNSKFASLLDKPFQDLANFIGDDIDGAIALSTVIPSLQDGNGQQCALDLKTFGEVIKAHPAPLTFKVVTDLEAFRLKQMAVNRLCASTACTVVFADITQTITALSPMPLPIPSLHDLCSKVPTITVVAPVTIPPAAAPKQP
jgi:hypothetical protein